jgi:hypothetical protein
MSKAALALLAADADESTQEESPSKRAIALLEGRAQPDSSKPKVPVMSPFEDPDVGAGEAVLHGVTKLAASAVGGAAGVGSLLMGRGNDSAADTVDWWQKALTYEPRTDAGAGATDVGAQVLASPMNPASWIGRSGEFAAQKAEEAGWSPGAVTAMRMAPEALAAATGAPGVSRTVGASVSADARAAADAAGLPKAIEGARAVAEKARRAIRPDEAPAGEINPFARESLGAAASRPMLKDLSPELRAEIQKQAYRGGVDRSSLERQIEADQLPVRMQLTEGQATQDPVMISHEMNRRGKDPEFAARFNEQNQQLIDNLDEIRRQAAPSVVGNDHLQNGQQLVDSYKTVDAAATDEINAAYKAARDANGGDLPMDGNAFTTSADAALKKNMKARYLPAQIAADLGEIRENGAMNFETFENMRTNLAAEARKAERSGDGNATAAIRIVRDALENAEPVGRVAEVKPLFDKARTLAKARFDRIKADPAYKAAAEDDVGIGEASPLADGFVQKYIVHGKAAHIARMQENLAGDSTASETIAAGALNYVKSKSGVNLYTNEGNFSQAGYNRALAEITPKLEQLVGGPTAEQLEALGNVARHVQAQPRGSFVNHSNTTVAAYAANIAKSAAERSVNALVPGADLGTLAREKLGRRAEKRATREALKPGAGIALKTLVQQPKRLTGPP